VNWSVHFAPSNADATGPTEFVIATPIKFKAAWRVETDDKIDLCSAVNFRLRLDRSDQWVSHGYSADILSKIHSEVSETLEGNGSTPANSESSAYEVALELLMQAQELVTSEDKQRRDERPETVCSALINTAAACEVYVKGFIQTYGSSLHRFLIENQSFSVRNFLHKVIADIPQIGKSLKSVNAELMHNLFLLSRARNSAVHRGRPQLTLSQRREVIEAVDEDIERITIKETQHVCAIEGWMVYRDMPRELLYADSDGEFGSFVWDVLALIEWLRVMVGGQWMKPAVHHYWNQESKKPVGTRESEILGWKLELERRTKK
jgi:hypothetical protein